MAKNVRRRRRRRTNWKAVFWMWLLGIVLGVALGVWLCANYNVLPALEKVQSGDVRAAMQVLTSGEREYVEDPLGDETAIIAEPTPAAVEEPEITPEPTAEITPEPVVITPEPVVITPAPVEPTPEPAEETPAPVEETPTEAPAVQEPTEEPVVEETAAKTATLTQPFSRTEPNDPGEWFAFDTEIDADGKPYYMDDGEGQVASIALRIADFMDPDDYAAQYADVYQLYGSEAALVLEIRNDSDIAIKPQDAIRIAFANKADVLYDGYPLMDAAMAGSTDISIAPGETMTVYKRFAYDDLEGLFPFMTVTYMVGGETYRSYTYLNGLN